KVSETGLRQVRGQQTSTPWRAECCSETPRETASETARLGSVSQWKRGRDSKSGVSRCLVSLRVRHRDRRSRPPTPPPLPRWSAAVLTTSPQPTGARVSRTAAASLHDGASRLARLVGQRRIYSVCTESRTGRRRTIGGFPVTTKPG